MTLTIECTGPQAARIQAVCEAAGVPCTKTVVRYGYTHSRTVARVQLDAGFADAVARSLRAVAAHVQSKGQAGAGAWVKTAEVLERAKEGRVAV